MATKEHPQARNERFHRIDPSLFLDDLGQDGDVEMDMGGVSKRCIIAVDFGTTFSSVAYTLLTEDTQDKDVDLMNVRCIAGYPDDQLASVYEPRQEVPTEIWYPPRPPQRRGRTVVKDTTPTNDLSDGECSNDSDTSYQGFESMYERDDNATTYQDGSFDVPNDLEPLYWGYGVQKQLRMSHIAKDHVRRITRFKLMLDETNVATDGIRAGLTGTFTALHKMGLINTWKNGGLKDVISDSLKQLFTHTKQKLQESRDWDNTVPIEYVLCVPAVWSTKACRTMQAAITTAIQRSGLGGLHHDNVKNLFIVSEPEAAAAGVLAENNTRRDIYPGEVIIILDAGGGTVDAVTYKVTNSHPLRLDRELVEPGSALCGSSYINERLGNLLMEKLQGQHYLEKNGRTIQSIVDAQVTYFENNDKRTINISEKNFHWGRIEIPDLQPDESKNFFLNEIELTRNEVIDLYAKSFKGTVGVMKEQLQMANAKGFSVQKVLLVGGFAQSDALRKEIDFHLRKERNAQGDRIEFVYPTTPSTIVARGAVLRAIDKDLGPERVTLCSYGFLTSEPFEPEVCDAHKRVKPDTDKADGERYVNNTIQWVINKGDKLPARGEPIRRNVKHTFSATRKHLKCEEELYVSEMKHQSHYRKNHPMNKGAELAGRIVVDMTWLLDQRIIRPKPPSEWSKHRNPKTLHYDVEFDLIITVDGRNLYFEAKWPKSNLDEPPPPNQTVQGQGQIPIAAAFTPGTA